MKSNASESSISPPVQIPIVFPDHPIYPKDIYFSSDVDVDVLGIPPGTSFLDLIDLR